MTPELENALIESDAILQRVFWSDWILAPLDGEFEHYGRRGSVEQIPHDAELNCARARLADLCRLWRKAGTLRTAENLQFSIRDVWRDMRDHSAGYFLWTTGPLFEKICRTESAALRMNDIAEFANPTHGQYFEPDPRKRTQLWHRFERQSAPYRRRLFRV